MKLLGAVGFGALAAIPTPLESDRWFARSSTANIAWDVGHELRDAVAPPSPVPSPALDAEVTPTPKETDNRPENVALIVFESVGASATSLGRSELETTPFLEELAKRSTVARDAYVTVPHTSKALVALLCGIEPNLSFEITAAQPDGIPARCLPRVLDDHGYDSAFFQTANPDFENRGNLVDNIGFDEFFTQSDLDRDAYHRVNYFGWEDDAMLPVSRRWLEGRSDGDRPFVATYLTITSHHPYRTPPDFEGEGSPPDDLPPDADRYRRYLDSVRYVDRFSRKLVRQYRKLGLYEDTLFVFVSDHGEAFGEHGMHFHGEVPYEEVVHVPAVVHDPTRPEAPDVERNSSHLDITPTILDRLGFALTEGGYRGTSLERIPPRRPVRMQCYLENRCLVRITGRTKLVHWLDQRPDAVYDLSESPLERRNIAGDFDRLADWRRDLLEWRRHVRGMHAAHPFELN